MKTSDYLLQRIKDAIERGETDTYLGKAIAKWRDPICVGDGTTIYYERLIFALSALRETLHAIDPAISPNLPPCLLDPRNLSEMFGQTLSWSGIPAEEALAAITKSLERIAPVPAANPSPFGSRLWVDIDGQYAVLDKEKWPLANKEQVLFLDDLITAGGQFVPLSDMAKRHPLLADVRGTRLVAQLLPRLRKIIISKPGAGYAISLPPLRKS